MSIQRCNQRFNHKDIMSNKHYAPFYLNTQIAFYNSKKELLIENFVYITKNFNYKDSYIPNIGFIEGKTESMSVVCYDFERIDEVYIAILKKQPDVVWRVKSIEHYGGYLKCIDLITVPHISPPEESHAFY